MNISKTLTLRISYCIVINCILNPQIRTLLNQKYSKSLCRETWENCEMCVHIYFSFEKWMKDIFSSKNVYQSFNRVINSICKMFVPVLKHKAFKMVTNGQLISNVLLVSPNHQTKFSLVFLVDLVTPKVHFEINWPLV